MKDQYILIVGQASWMSAQKASPLIKAAKARGYSVIRIGPAKRFQDQEDVFILDPLSSPAVLIEKLRKLSGQIDFVFPTSDAISHFISKPASILQIPFVSEDLASKVNSKLGLSTFLEENNFKTPRTWLLRSLEDFDKIPSQLPLLVKANLSTGALPKHNWDYRSFPNKSELLRELKETACLDAFFTSSHQDENIQSIVQEDLRGSRLLDVHVVFRGKNSFQIFLIGEFQATDSDFLIVESKTAQQISDQVMSQITKIVSFFSQQGCEYLIGNLQFADKNEDLFLFDLNLRVAGIWSYLYKIMMPDFFERMFAYFEGEETTFSLKFPYYLKTPYWLSPGKTVRFIQVPRIEDDQVLIAYTDQLVSGYRVPLVQDSIQPSPQIFSVGNSEAECRSQIERILSQTTVQYYE